MKSSNIHYCENCLNQHSCEMNYKNSGQSAHEILEGAQWLSGRVLDSRSRV